MKFSLNGLGRLVGCKFNSPMPEINYVTDLLNRARYGDATSAYTLYEIAHRTTPTLKAKASVTIGSGESGCATVIANDYGVGGNEFTIQVAINAGVNKPLSVMVTDTDILVILGTGSQAGVVDNAKNTAKKVAQSIGVIDGTPFYISYSGTGETAITDELEKTNFSGGTDGYTAEEYAAWNIAVEAVAELFE